MTVVVRSWLPGGQAWITARLRCDGCGAWGSGPLGTDRPGDLAILRARLRILSARRLGWAIRDVRVLDLAANPGPTARVDVCPVCLRERAQGYQEVP